jgi:hypothetical protein
MTATASVIVRNRTPEDVAADLLAAKKLHEETKKLVLEHEQELIDMLGQLEEGSKTHRLQGFKVEVKGVINRKVDWPTFDAVCQQIAQQEAFFMEPVKVKRELDETEVKRLAREQPGVYARLAKALTATPGKTGVTVSRTE